MKTPPIYLHGLSYCLGTPHCVDDLVASEGLSDLALKEFQMRGVSTFCKRSTDMNVLRLQACLAAVEAAGRTIADIDHVIFANALPRMTIKQEFSLLNGLQRCGVTADSFLSVDMAHCSAFPIALNAAGAAIQLEDKKHVLILLSGSVSASARRARAALGTVYGDGAAACIVSLEPGRYQLLATHVKTDLRARYPEPSQTSTNNIFRAYNLLRETVRLLLNKARVTPDDLSAVFAIYGSNFYTQLAASAARVSEQIVYDAPLKRYGHVFSCEKYHWTF